MKFLIPFLSFLFLISFGAEMAFSDDVSPVAVLEEDFEGVFPPEGWSVESANQDNTWRQINSAADGNLTDIFDGQYFAYVGGPTDQVYEESIITSNIKIPGSGDCKIDFYFAYDPAYSLTDDFDLSVEISHGVDSSDINNWTMIGSIKEVTDIFHFHSAQNDWYNGSTMWFYIGSSFSLRFKYTSSSGIGFALDNIYVQCLGSGHSGVIDDDDDNENTKKDSNSNKEEDCNCGLTFHDPAAPLALLMVLVGCGALLISRRR